ncbi:MAG: transposase [Myxococcaceae bacterium]|nr:transposase [Myxococcaceae bacterium]MCA3013750.1 transposase [Myxococcaceae bacterium]
MSPSGAVDARRRGGGTARPRCRRHPPARLAPGPKGLHRRLQHSSLQRPLSLDSPPRPRKRRGAVARGFSVHADTAVHGNDRDGLERLARSRSRGPISESRLRHLADWRRRPVPGHVQARVGTLHQS